MTIFESLSYCTTRIECWNTSGQLSTGTGFFLNIHESPEKNLCILITNKHVIKDSIRWRFTLSNKNSMGTPILDEYTHIESNSTDSEWVLHPESDVDLCAIDIDKVIEKQSLPNRPLYYESFSKEYLPTAEDLEDLGPLEDLIIIGYPSGIWDSFNNRPIFRRGITATSLKINYEGKSRFLVDAAIFPGSSGSPVVIANLGWHMKKDAVTLGSRFVLIGVVFAVFQHTVQGEVKVVPINQMNTIALTNIPNNLGVAVNYIKLLDFEKLFSL